LLTGLIKAMLLRKCTHKPTIANRDLLITDYQMEIDCCSTLSKVWKQLVVVYLFRVILYARSKVQVNVAIPIGGRSI